MKKMTYKQLGGACNKSFSTNTFEEKKASFNALAEDKILIVFCKTKP